VIKGLGSDVTVVL